jgi:S-disulfanyl-L-cysteine oxidoreductase SoxD
MRRPAIFLLAFATAALTAAKAQTTSVWDGVYTDVQAARGAQTFVASCAGCHGGTLGGTGEAPALVGLQFLSDFNGLTLGDVFDRIRTSMPQNNPGSLTRDQYADTLAYILKANAMPAGAKELDRRSEYLKAIGFEAADPHPAETRSH